MRYLSLALVILLFGAFIAFAVVNRAAVEVNFPFAETHFEAPLFLILFAIYVLGMFTGGAFFGFIRSSIERAAVLRNR